MFFQAKRHVLMKLETWILYENRIGSQDSCVNYKLRTAAFILQLFVIVKYQISLSILSFVAFTKGS